MRISDWSSDVCSSDLAARGAVIDLIPEMMRLTLDILMRTLFSLRLDDEHVDIFEALTVVLRDAERRIWSPFSPPQIGRASCRERVCQYVYISVVDAS